MEPLPYRLPAPGPGLLNNGLQGRLRGLQSMFSLGLGYAQGMTYARRAQTTAPSATPPSHFERVQPGEGGALT